MLNTAVNNTNDLGAKEQKGKHTYVPQSTTLTCVLEPKARKLSTKMDRTRAFAILKS